MVKLRKPEDIAAAVEVMDDRTRELRDRFEEDYSLYRLDPFTGVDRDDGWDPEEGYAHYTSNEPQTFADKIINFAVLSKLMLRIRHPNSQEQARKSDDQKERFMFGLLRAGDERLRQLLQPTLRSQLSFFAAVRGFTFGRSMLVKRADGTTFVDIQPWDPLNTYWDMNGDGLEWACYRIRKTLVEIQSQYPDVDVSDLADTTAGSRGGEGEDPGGFETFDFYDKEINTVVMSDRVLKAPTDHGSDRVPVFYTLVGATPLIQPSLARGNLDLRETIKDWGESVFKADRKIYDNHNQMMSILLELAGRSRNPPTDVHSPDGSKTLEEDPWVAGSEISTAEGESVQAMEPVRSTPDLAPFLALVSGEMQRGALPHTAFGELPFQLSGFAIQTLRQGIETVLTPVLEAVEDSIRQICRIISDQYATGSFDEMEFSGYDRERQYFRETIQPEAIRQGGDIEIKLVSILPQDDVQKAVMAQQMREGPVPLVPDRWLREEVLGIQDPDSIDAQIKEQLGERLLPEAALWDIMVAMEETGRQQLAGFYFAELQEILFKKELERRQARVVAQQSGLTNGANGSAPGVAPTAQPSQSLGGGANPASLSNPGPQQAPGTPRPGAQSNNGRLASLGLVGPGG
tara:strand:- start:160 stop:2049 length:1890 start_codon:yes stop_codon:yes gene_type:complete